MTKKYDLYIDGQSVASSSGEYFETLSPADGSVVAEVARGTAEDIGKAASSAAEALEGWRSLSALDRSKHLRRFAEALRDNAAYLGQIESDEMGMPTQMAPQTIHGSADFYDYYGGLAPSLLGEVVPLTPDKFSYNLVEPFGVVGIITPWNSPMNQASRSAAPALAAGNTVVLKPSEFSSIASVEMARIAVEAGLPKGVLNTVTGYGGEIGSALVDHPLVNKVAFTGSIATGQVIGQAAARKVMSVTLELGGKSPHIIFEDANLEAALPMVLFGFVANSGQICRSGTRVLIQRSIYDKFSAMLKAAAEQVPIGRDKNFPTLGPMANEMQYKKVLEYFESAKSEGATLLTGGEKASGDALDKGLYLKPTIYTDVNTDMRIVKEEIFGPVAVLIPFENEDEAIRIANDTEYGLGAGLWSRDVSRVHRVAAKLEAGSVYVNTYHANAIEATTAGYKKSGVGREQGVLALKEYVQMKNVTMQL